MRSLVFVALLMLSVLLSIVQATPLCDESCTFYKAEWDVLYPPQNSTVWMIRVLSDSQEIKYDGGWMDGGFDEGYSTSTSGSGLALRFNVNSIPFHLTAVKVYGRYYCNNTQEFCNSLLQNQTFCLIHFGFTS